MKKFREAQELATEIDNKADRLDNCFLEALDSYAEDIAQLERLWLRPDSNNIACCLNKK